MTLAKNAERLLLAVGKQRAVVALVAPGLTTCPALLLLSLFWFCFFFRLTTSVFSVYLSYVKCFVVLNYSQLKYINIPNSDVFLPFSYFVK